MKAMEQQVMKMRKELRLWYGKKISATCGITSRNKRRK
jgi:hypothetical protein